MVEVIAEAGISHSGKLDVAKNLAEIAAQAGADAVKFQTYDPYKLYKNPPAELLKAALKPSEFKVLAKHCETLKIEFMSTPGDVDSLKFLVEECGVKRIKIGSDDLTFQPLVDAAYRTGKPVILSTGMATVDEIKKALPYDGGFVSVTLMHCMSLYPTPIEHANLSFLGRLKFMGYPVGYSDHTNILAASLMAMAMGATIIEKHFCPSGYAGPDWKVSSIPTEFRMYVASLRDYEKMLGNHLDIINGSRFDRANIRAFRKGEGGMRDGT